MSADDARDERLDPPAAERADDESPVSLDQLTQAFAEAMGRPPRAPAAPSGPAGGAESRPNDSPIGGANEERPASVSPTAVLEAVLFVGNPNGGAITPSQASDLMRGVTPDEIPELVDELNARYLQRGCPYTIVAEGAGYRLTLAATFSGLRTQFYGGVREAQLSRAAVDVLAIVAYQQPVKAEHVSRLRGRPSDKVLGQLVRRGLLKIERTKEKPRTAFYSTTERFLEVFGLESLADLPHGDAEIDER